MFDYSLKGYRWAKNERILCVLCHEKSSLVGMSFFANPVFKNPGIYIYLIIIQIPLWLQIQLVSIRCSGTYLFFPLNWLLWALIQGQ